MEVKIQCHCGTKYKFDVEPVNGRMPMRVQCPGCGADGTTDANQYIAQKQPYTPGAPTVQRLPSPPVATAIPATAVPASGGGLRLAGSAASSAARVAEPEPSAAAEAGARGHGARSLLERRTFFVKERVAVLKLTDTYDILDPAGGQVIGVAKEEPPGWAKWLRLAIAKGKLPTAINIYEVEGQPPVLSIRRGVTFIRSKIQVFSGDGRNLGYFRSKLISIGGGFNVFDARDQQVAEVKGNWKGWDFRFLNKSGREIGTVTKKWAGLGKELFTSADNYVISLTDAGSTDSDAAALLLAAGLSIDVVFKEAQ
jgi:uncharacterized protein YxjI